ncbi:MAG TPA: serine/threonine-protein kinase, partial [Polyangiaceae bacterium]
RAAYAKAQIALEKMEGLVDALEGVTDEVAGTVARRTSLTVLHQLDQSLLERSTLDDLLRLAPSPEATKAHESATMAARDRIASWVLDRFREREAEDKKDAPVKDAVLRLRRLRAMLHLVDSDLEGDDPTRTQTVRKRWAMIAAVLLNRMAMGLPPILRRANAATLSRTLDALVRAEALDPADALLAVARRVAEPGEIRVLAEAAMDPSLRHAFARWADLAAAPDDKALDALDVWARDGLLDPSSRAEALRTMIVRLQQSTSAIVRASSLAELADVAPVFETAVSSIAQLCASARARLESDGKSVPAPALFDLAVAVSRVLSGAEEELSKTTVDEARTAAKTLPPAIARVALRGIDALAALPRETSRREPSEVLRQRMNEALPAWLPARRTLGGFYVMRPLASGGGGSVLVAVRIEDKGEDDAERFALKVPAYDASAARTVSEAEFFQMFRDEASALLAIPSHPNLARFVTFDTGSRPKPILVMELVEGENLEHAITSRSIDASRAFKLLDDVLSGLEAMHSVEVGHLDLKPSNVVLRRGKDAVLVDFGLAGRRVRPGCATGPYGAPEVWAADGASTNASPRSADVYAFGCVAFEALTGDILFQADSELQQIAMHLSHDGFPEKLRKLATKPQLQPLAEVLFSALRRDPQKRPSVPQLRAELRRLAPTFAGAKWPLS